MANRVSPSIHLAQGLVGLRLAEAAAPAARQGHTNLRRLAKEVEDVREPHLLEAGMTLSQDQKTSLRGAYDQLCVSYRAIDDFRAKLLGFLPLVTGGGLLLLTGKADGFAREFFLPVGIFGLVVTLGLFSYEIYGIKKCHALINAGKTMEASLELPTGQGQFQNRPRDVLGHINEPFAAAIIYPAVMAAWTYLAAFDAPRWVGAASAVGVFIVGFAITFEYNRRLGEDTAGAHDDPVGRERMPAEL